MCLCLMGGKKHREKGGDVCVRYRWGMHASVIASASCLWLMRWVRWVVGTMLGRMAQCKLPRFDSLPFMHVACFGACFMCFASLCHRVYISLPPPPLGRSTHPTSTPANTTHQSPQAGFITMASSTKDATPLTNYDDIGKILKEMLPTVPDLGAMGFQCGDAGQLEMWSVKARRVVFVLIDRLLSQGKVVQELRGRVEEQGKVVQELTERLGDQEKVVQELMAWQIADG